VFWQAEFTVADNTIMTYYVLNPSRDAFFSSSSLNDDELEVMCYEARDFIASFQFHRNHRLVHVLQPVTEFLSTTIEEMWEKKGLFVNTSDSEKRGYFLKALKFVDPWVRYIDNTVTHDRAQLFSGVLITMLLTEHIPLEHHYFLAQHLVDNARLSRSDVCTDDLFKFAKEVHIMLEVQKTEAWIYLDVLGTQFENCHLSGDGTLLEQLQRLGTPVLLILALTDRDTDLDRVQITLRLLLCFAEHGISSQFDEKVRASLMSGVFTVSGRLQSWDSSNDHGKVHTVTNLIARILAQAESIELSNLFCFRSFEDVFKIQNRSDLLAYCPLFERLTESDQLRYLVTSSHLSKSLWSEWMENNGCGMFFENKYLWGVWTNLFLFPIIGFDFDILVSGVSRKLHEYDSVCATRNPMCIRYSGCKHTYNSLRFKFDNPIMKPSDIFFTQDSISQFFQDFKIVSQTEDALYCRKLSSHRIPPIHVFGWDGGGEWRIHTEDNRRLYAYKEAGLQSVPVKFTTRKDVNRTKFSTKNGGKQVRVR